MRGWPLMMRRAPKPVHFPSPATGGANLPCQSRSGVEVA
jgi:hypothetical protein